MMRLCRRLGYEGRCQGLRLPWVGRWWHFLQYCWLPRRGILLPRLCALPLPSINDLVVRDEVEALDLKFVEGIIVHTSTLVTDEVCQSPPSSMTAVSAGFPRLTEHSCQLVRLLSELQQYKNYIMTSVISMLHIHVHMH